MAETRAWTISGNVWAYFRNVIVHGRGKRVMEATQGNQECLLLWAPTSAYSVYVALDRVLGKGCNN